MDVEIHMNGKVLIIDVGGNILPASPELKRFDKKTCRLFGLNLLQQRLARIGRCPFCKTKAVRFAERLEQMDIRGCGKCGRLLIVPDEPFDPFMRKHSSRTNSAND